MARMQRTDGSWGPLSEAQFTTGVPADASNLRISEIQYHPGSASAAEVAAGFSDADEFEFIELVNIASTPIDLTQVRFQQTVEGNDVVGIDFAFTDGSVRELAPGGRAVIVENMEAFQMRYGNLISVAGEWSGGLSNASERLVLVAGDQTIADFSYDDGWHPTTDGDGPSLQAVNEAGDLATLGTAAAWRPSAVSGGSPGRSEGPIPGDSNHDGIFNSGDLVMVFAAGKYEDSIAGNATFEDGDWDGDGDFTTGDLVFAFQAGTYVSAALPQLASTDSVVATLFAANNRDATGSKSALVSTSAATDELDALFAEWGEPNQSQKVRPLV